MKANLKGLGGIKGLFLKHCEKLGMLLVAGCALMIIYSSLQLERLPEQNQPEKLQSLISQAKNQIDEFRWEDMPAEEVKVAEEFSTKLSGGVNPKDYETDAMNRPVVQPTVPRTDPLLLTVQDLEVHSGSGLLASTDEEVQRQRKIQLEIEAAQKERDREAERERQKRDAERGGRANRRQPERGRGELVDPDHPNRRRVVGRARVPGVPLRGDEKIEKVYWATVVGKVPIEDQLQLYRDALENSQQYSPGTDCPEYLGYYVQRAEVLPGKELKWQRVFIGANKTIDSKIKDWAPSQPEVIDPRSVEPILTFPLPPVAYHDWGKDATHSEILLAEEVQPEEEPELVEEVDEASEDGEVDFLAGGQGRRSRGPIGGRGGEYGGGFGGEYGGGFGGEYGGGFGGEYGGGFGGEYGGGFGGEYGGGFGGEYGGGYGGEGGGYSSVRGRQTRQVSRICDSEVPHLLFRFFDFTVRPGKRYKYRVQLVMADVNHDISPGKLDTTVLERRAKLSEKKRPTRTTDWSDASPTASIPHTGNVRVASASAPSANSFNSEPSVKLLVQSFDIDMKGNALQAAKERSLERGHVANMTEEAEYLLPGGRMIDKKEFQFHTDIAVVDIEGGEKITRDLSKPARVLLMDPTGRLYIRDETEDKEDVDLHAAVFAEEEKGGRGGFDYGGEYGGGYGGEGGFGGFEGF